MSRLAAELSSRPVIKPDDRFDMLRRIAKELHPDFSTGGGLDKLLRAECFKKLWPEIERIAERRWWLVLDPSVGNSSNRPPPVQPLLQ